MPTPVNPPDPAHALSPDDILFWRERFLHLMLRISLVLGLIVYVSTLFLAWHTGDTSILVVDTLAFFSIVFLNVNRRGSFFLRAALFCGVIYALGVDLILTVGPAGQAYLLGLSVLATVLFGLRIGIIGAVFNIGTVLVLAQVFEISVTPAMEESGWGFIPFSGVVLTAVFALATGLLVLTLGMMQSALQSYVRRLAESNALLRREASSRTLAEADLQASQEAFRELAENIDEVFYNVEVDTRRVLYVNSRSQTVWNVAPGELYDGTIQLFDKVHPDDREILEEWRARQDNRAGREPDGPMEYRIMTAGGSTRWVRDHARPVLDAAGRIVRVVGTARDITDEHRIAQECASLDAQLQHSQKMELIGQLAGGMAHDFNNMLNVILTHAGLVREAAADQPHIREDLEQIILAGERSAELTRQLLAFARRQAIRPVALNLNDTIAGMTRMLARLVGEDISIDWRPGAGVGSVYMDPTQVDQLLVHLLVNARDAIAGVGRITVKTGAATFDTEALRQHPGMQPGAFAWLAVSDTGRGMDEATREHVFEPFFTTKGVDQGAGLGLSTVFGIVKQNEGMITVDSAPGEGTTFQLYFPVHAASAAEGTVVPVSSVSQQGRGTVLVVEDEPQLLKVVRRLLTRRGYHVLSAPLPGEAIRIAESYPDRIHLMITDVVMPEMNGREVWEHLQSKRPEMRCLYISGYTADIIDRYGILDDGTNFLQKPFTETSLLDKVREIL